MDAMRTHNPRMTPIVHDLVLRVPKHVCRTGVPLGPTSKQALDSQHIYFRHFLPPYLNFPESSVMGNEKPIVATAR